MKKRDYTQYDFESIFEISTESPSGLVWKIPRLYVKTLHHDRVGKQAGTIKITPRQKYYNVVVFNKKFQVHRIIWLLHNKTIDAANDIDHIDGNTLNNSVTNLREISPAVNSRNRRKKRDKELEAGIYLEESLSKAGTPLPRLRAHICVEGRVIGASFSITKYGHEGALKLAKDWRKNKLDELNEQGAGYTDRHGT